MKDQRTARCRSSAPNASPKAKRNSSGSGSQQARETLRRNDALLCGDAQPDEDDKAKIAGVRTASSAAEGSGVSRGDYSND